jgi:tetratricopeptide (TPR) repeat protein/transcriptional regulator with XRE-family HTH domain
MEETVARARPDLNGRVDPNRSVDRGPRADLSGRGDDQAPDAVLAAATDARTVTDLAAALRHLRRREARRRREQTLTYRELAERTGWSLAVISEYFAGTVLPPTDRLDVLVHLLGASPAEKGALATARDRAEERRRAGSAQEDRAGAGAGSTAVARELPSDVFAFTGRTAHLGTLSTWLADHEAASAVPISAVSGTAGVGKTALAVRWAHQVADRYPDGQLYINLGGYDQAEPVAPGTALARFLRSLGVSGPAPSHDEAELAARYRSLMAGRRMIVLLDNARTAEQVRLLLPGTADHLVLVTSRNDLAGLVARDGARRIDLDVMSEAEATELLRTLIGTPVAAEPHAARELAALCGHLPLALRIAAERARLRSHLPLADIVDDLRQERRRLDMLDAGGDPRAIRAVFGWSIRHVSPAAASAFSLLGLLPGRSFDDHCMASLTATGLDDARRVTEELTRAHVVSPTDSGRYAMHDLMRAYAAERAAADLAPDMARAALTRLFDYYLDAAAAAVRTLYPHLNDRHLQRGGEWSRPAHTQPDEALRWLDAERANLTAMAGLPQPDWPQLAGLSMILHRYLLDQAHLAEALVVHRAAVEATGGDDGHVLINLATILHNLGRVDEAVDHLRRALAPCRDAGDAHGAGRALANLAFISMDRGDFRPALELQAQALDAYRAAGVAHLEAMTLLQMGSAKERLGRYDEAAEDLHAALAICRRHDIRPVEGYTLGELGTVYGHLGRETEAIELIQRCLDICREFNAEGQYAQSQVDLAAIHTRQGRHPAALVELEAALDIAQRLDSPHLHLVCLNGLGQTLTAAGRPAEALVRHRTALAIACRLGNRYQQARALEGVGAVLDAEGHRPRALRLWRRALATYAELGVPEADAVRRRLA